MGIFDNLLHISVNLSPQNDPKNDLTSRNTREIPTKYPRKRGENNVQFTMHNAQCTMSGVRVAREWLINCCGMTK